MASCYCWRWKMHSYAECAGQSPRQRRSASSHLEVRYNGPAHAPSEMSFLLGIWTTSNTTFFLGHTSLQQTASWSVLPFLLVDVLSTPTVRHTEQKTDTDTPTVLHATSTYYLQWPLILSRPVDIVYRPGSRRGDPSGLRTNYKYPPALGLDTGHDRKFPCICSNMSKIYF